MSTGQGKVYIGDTPLIEVTTGIDLTNVVIKVLKVFKPNGIKVDWIATVKAPATAGVLQYQCAVADLPAKGIYKLQAYVTFAGGKVYTGEMATFRIYDLWE
jgi:hypothetical protein